MPKPAKPTASPEVFVLRELERVGKRTRGRVNSEYPQLNVRETANRLGVSHGHLGRILNGKLKPGLKLAGVLAEALGITIEEVLEKCNDKRKRKRKFNIPGAGNHVGG